MSSKSTCHVCGRPLQRGEGMPAAMIRPSVRRLVERDHPGLADTDLICQTDLNHYRAAYVEDLLAKERGEISALDREVVASLRGQETVVRDLNRTFDAQATFGERVADRMADFGGSWAFIGLFVLVLASWIALNALLLTRRPWDPYPFILLNLVLSCLAAIQAPVIMMSQKRQEDRDRMQAQQDYVTNLKAELEIRHLHSKLDQLLTSQWTHLLEVQQIQMELMDELGRRLPEPGEPDRA